KRSREHSRRRRIHPNRLVAFNLGPDGVEVHEPRLEDRPSHRLQRLVHPAVQVDLVVEGTEDLGDCLLFGERRQGDWKFGDCVKRKLSLNRTGAVAPVPRISTKSGPFSRGEWLESPPGSARGY